MDEIKIFQHSGHHFTGRAHITSEQRPTAISRANIFTQGGRSAAAAKAGLLTTQHSLSSSASTNTSKVMASITQKADSIHISPGRRQYSVISLFLSYIRSQKGKTFLQ